MKKEFAKKDLIESIEKVEFIIYKTRIHTNKPLQLTQKFSEEIKQALLSLENLKNKIKSMNDPVN